MYSPVSKAFFASRNVVLVGGKRTPIGTIMGKLSNYSAPHLGAIAIRGAISASHVDPKDIEEVIMGNVCSAGQGQAPARQASLGAQLSEHIPCTTINKVCSSGLKAITLAAQAIALGDRDVVIAGGMESMSKIPHYIYMRKGLSYGNTNLIDGLAHDGLQDPYHNIAMGSCCEKTIAELGITREAQDEYAIRSYEKARENAKNGVFAAEIVEIIEKTPKGENRIAEDEECQKFLRDKIPTLKPAFSKNGTITAANASKLNDGACAFVVMAEEVALAKGLKPLARIIAYEDAEVAPIDFSIAPTSAMKRVLKKAKMDIKDIEYHEMNEAFSAVPLANMKLMDLSLDKVNVHGGAVALGHPIGVSGARILLSLTSVLRRNDATIGMASICNGGGGSTAVIIERLN